MAPAQNPITSAWSSFWHTMTSKDRHASHNSPFRSGANNTLTQSRHDPLTSVVSNRDEAHDTLATSLDQDDSSTSYFGQPIEPASSSTSPYTPGMRKASIQRRQSDTPVTQQKNPAEVQMQTFSDGLPPPPPVSHSWKRIERWVEDNYEELNDNISPGCTQNDINELEHDLDCTLPLDVRESLQVHDGQERGGNPTGIVFGSMLLDCEEIVQEWKNWRTVNEEFLNSTVYQNPQMPLKAFGGSGESSSSNPPSSSNAASSGDWREELIARQDSQPTGAVQKAYSHPAWIPLVRDWGGNNLAVDLSPGPAGKWGQVILMGRDYDCKYVVSRSWAAFLATLADDLTSKKAFIVEDSGELKLREFPNQNVEPGYLDILRWRADQKYGRKPPRRRSVPNGQIRINSNVPPTSSQASPYSTSSMDGDRGRSPQRLSGKSHSLQSPRATISNAKSPLARVAEEPASKNASVNGTPLIESTTETDALMTNTTPRMSVVEESKVRDNTGNVSAESHANKENQALNGGLSGLSLKNVDVGESGPDEMKTVDI